MILIIQTSEILPRVRQSFSGAKGAHQTYEALRDVHRHDHLQHRIFWSATICRLWLIQHCKATAVAVIARAAAAAVHWACFDHGYLIGAYFHKIQYRIIHFNIFTEHFYWVVCAAQSLVDAQKICREIDPNVCFHSAMLGRRKTMKLNIKKPPACGARGQISRLTFLSDAGSSRNLRVFLFRDVIHQWRMTCRSSSI